MPAEKDLAMGAANLFDVAVDLEEMGRRMDAAREQAGLTVFELAVKTVIGESLLRRYLRGDTEPGAKRLARIAKELGVSSDWLLQNTDNPQPAGDVWKKGKSPERRANPPTSGGAPFEEMDVPPRQKPRKRHTG